MTVISTTARPAYVYDETEDTWYPVGAQAIAFVTTYVYTATASQTVFSGADDNSQTLSYTTGAVKVFLNGALLTPDTDYSALNGTSVTLGSGAAANDILVIVAADTYQVADTYTQAQIDVLTNAPNEFIGTTAIELQQFAADGSVLQNLPARIHPAERLLKQSVLWLDAAHDTAGDQTIQNLGWGGAALNAQSGSTGSADSNDPKFLEWDGENYVYLPGVALNYLSVPDAAALDITGDFDLRALIAMDDWTPANLTRAVSKFTTSNLSFELYVNTTGVLILRWSENGTTPKSAISTVVTGLTDGTVKWIRATMDVDNGASGNDVQFFLSDDAVTWTQLGATVTTAAVTSVFSGTGTVGIGATGAGTAAFALKVYRAQILDGIDGTPVLDVDCSQIVSGADTSFTALTGQTVTINRGTAGRKSVAVVNPCWLFGTDDYMEVADNDLIDFGATDSFTVLAMVRQWNTPTSFGRILDKDGATVGYSVLNLSTNLETYLIVDDGTTAIGSGTNKVTYTSGQYRTLAMTLNRDTNLLALAQNGISGTASDASALGSIANAEVLRIGRVVGGTAYADMELIAAAVFRRALTSTEITTISNYYQGRVG